MKVVFHIGLGRAASTFLQDVIFSRHEEINYISKSSQNYPDWLIDWHYLDDYMFERKHKGIQKTVNSLLSERKVNLISSEAFSGIGGFFFTQIKRIKRISPEAYVIIVLRDPIEAIKSFYKNNVEHEGFFHELEQYLDWKRSPFVFYKRKAIYLPDFFFDETLEVLESFFGREKVCVLKYEDLKEKPDGFYEKLGNFMGVSFTEKELFGLIKNPSPSENDLTTLRIDNFMDIIGGFCPVLARKVSVDIKVCRPERPLMSKELRNRLERYFKGKCYGYY